MTVQQVQQALEIVPGALIEALGQLVASTGDLTDLITRERNERAARKRVARLPVFATIQGVSLQGSSPTVTAGGTLLLDLGGPQIGQVWDVRRVTLSDAENWATSMGSANAVLFTGQPNPSGVVSPQNIVWAWNVLPNVTTFSRQQVVVQPSDHLLCYYYGGNTGQNLLLSGQIETYSPMDIATLLEEV
jgi:hypothetical protein